MANKKKALKNNVQKYRVWKNLLQKELAEKVGISVSELRLIEKNAVCPRLQHRIKLCEYFGVSHDQMFYNEQQQG
jgi:DNA-binding XRE family transcriptional regulator